MRQAPTFDPTSAKEPDLHLWLATLLCPTCKGIALTDQPCDCEGFPDVHSKMCLDCRDEDTKLSTGLALPWASEKCPYKDATQYFTQGKGLTMEALRQQEVAHNEGRWPDKCNGSGRVPKDVTPWEVTTAACLADDVEYVVFVRPRGKGAWVVRLEDCDGTPLVIGSGETPELAVLRAVAAKAVEETCPSS